jgi:hypothetical protein
MNRRQSRACRSTDIIDRTPIQAVQETIRCTHGIYTAILRTVFGNLRLRGRYAKAAEMRCR